MTRAGVLVLGSLNVDLVARAPRLPRPGETVIGHGFAVYPGGKGANQAVAAARAGGAAAMYGRVGEDAFGRQLLEALGREGVDVSGVVADPDAPTGVALIGVDEQGENAIIVAPGANHRVGEDDVRRCLARLPEAACLLLQLEIPLDAVIRCLREARQAGVRVVVDPAPAPPAGVDPAPLLAGAFAITPNEHEAAALAGLAPPADGGDLLPFAEAAARRLAAYGVRHVVITLGGRGCYWWDAEAGRGQHLPPFPVRAVDATAAGDAFAGALAVALAEGREFPAALRFAQAAGALAVTQSGAQPSLPRREAIERLVRG